MKRPSNCIWNLLKRILKDADVRLENAKYLYKKLAEIPGITFQEILPCDRSSFKDFTIRIETEAFGLERDHLKVALAKEGIGTRTYYVPPVHQHTTYQELVKKQPTYLPVTESLAGEVLSLPMYSHMNFECLDKVCWAICRIHQHAHQIGAELNGD